MCHLVELIRLRAYGLLLHLATRDMSHLPEILRVEPQERIQMPKLCPFWNRLDNLRHFKPLKQVAVSKAGIEHLSSLQLCSTCVLSHAHFNDPTKCWATSCHLHISEEPQL